MNAPLHVQSFLDRLEGVSKSGNGWAAQCPCRNDDNSPTLSVSVGKNDQVLVKCHRGGLACSVEEICKYMNIPMQELFAPGDDSWKKTDRNLKKKKTFVKAYDYTDENWDLLYQKVRYRHEDGSKSFTQRRPDPNKPGDYLYGLGSTRKVLYKLPELLLGIQAGEPVWLCEGEKDADTLVESGIIATTMPDGAGKWRQEYTDVLSKASAVMIVADNDSVGIKHALQVQGWLLAAGCPRVDVWKSPFGKDVSDHIALGHKVDELVPVDAELPEADAEQPPVEDNPEQLVLDRIVDIFSNPHLKPEQKVSRARSALDAFGLGDLGDRGRLVQWEEFLQEVEKDSYEWVIPGLIEKQERVIVVAAEGVGKTMLARQVALLSAAGLHPFTFQPMQPIRTLTIDLENPERIIRRTSRWIYTQAMKFAREKHHRRDVTCDAHILIKPSGIDLMSSSGRTIFEETVDRVRPELLCVGPLYKSYHDTGTLTSEALAVEVAKFLDYIRDVYGCALWLEHHAPLGQSQTTRELRPFGSAVWSRWPEFGIALSPDQMSGSEYVYDVRHFRGARDRRPWPIKMKRGVQFPFETLEFMKDDSGDRKSPVDDPERF